MSLDTLEKSVSISQSPHTELQYSYFPLVLSKNTNRLSIYPSSLVLCVPNATQCFQLCVKHSVCSLMKRETHGSAHSNILTRRI